MQRPSPVGEKANAFPRDDDSDLSFACHVVQLNYRAAFSQAQETQTCANGRLVSRRFAYMDPPRHTTGHSGAPHHPNAPSPPCAGHPSESEQDAHEKRTRLDPGDLLRRSLGLNEIPSKDFGESQLRELEAPNPIKRQLRCTSGARARGQQPTALVGAHEGMGGITVRPDLGLAFALNLLFSQQHEW